MDGLLNETKLILKSLVVSSPNKLTVNDLVRDYKNSEGRNIPYNELGYRNLEIFLNSMPDTILVNGSGLNASVSAVITERLAHIDKMVSQQKNATKGRKISGTVTLNSPPKRIIPPRMIKSFKPVEVDERPQIIPIQQPSSNQQHFTNPQRPYNERGIPNQMHFPQKPARININLNNQAMQPLMPSPMWQNQNVSYYKQNGWMNGPYQQQQTAMFRQQQNMMYNYSYLDYVEYCRSQAQAEYVRNQAHAANAMASGLWQQQYYNNSVPIGQIKQEHVISAPPVFYNNQNKDPVPEQSSLGDTCQSIQQLDKVTPNDSNAIEELVKEIEKLNISGNSSTPTRYSSDQLSKISSGSLPSFNNSISVSDELKSPVTTEHGTHKSEQTVPKPAKDLSDIESAECEALPELHQNDILFLIDYPSNTMKWGDHLLPPEIPANITIGSYFGIFVTEVHNPYKFWFHLHKEDNEFDSLMNDLEHFYKGLMPQELVIPRDYLKPGHVCAAPFLNMWHRGEIVERPENDTVKIFFLDYGTVSKINISNVKFLVNDFSSLQCQALRGCLAGIKPKNLRWSRSATYAFLSVVSDLLLYAKAVKINYEEHTAHVLLTDTTAEKDFQINDALICKGYAQLKPESDDNLSLHFQEKYPSFSMLEKGEYPNFAEIGKLLAKGIDFEAQMEENILPDLDEDNSIEDLAKILTGVKVSPPKPLKVKLLDCYNERSGKKSNRNANNISTKLSNHNQNNSSIEAKEIASQSSFADYDCSKESNNFSLNSSKSPHKQLQQPNETPVYSSNCSIPRNEKFYLSRIGPPPGFG